MSLRQRLLKVPFSRVTPRGIWELLSLAPPLGRSWPVAPATTIHLTMVTLLVDTPSIVRMLPRTVSVLTIIHIAAPTERPAGFTALTEGPRPVLPTILTLGRTPEVLPRMVRTEAGVWPRHIIPTPVPTLRLNKVRTLTVLGGNRSYPMVTNPPIPSITPMQMAPLDRFRAHRAEPPSALLPSTGTPPWPRPPAVTCTPPTTATSTKIPAQVGVHITTATGTR